MSEESNGERRIELAITLTELKNAIAQLQNDVKLLQKGVLVVLVVLAGAHGAPWATAVIKALASP